MKKYFLLIIIAIIACNISVLAQFKAKEGIETATSKVTASGFPSPTLMAIGTINGSIQGFPLQLTFDLSTGNATAWLYIFKSSTADTTAYVGVVKVLGSYMAYELSPSVIPDFKSVFSWETSLSDVSWFNSDEIGTYLAEDTDYQEFKTTNPDAKPSLIGVFSSAKNPWKVNLTYWGLFWELDGTNYTCAINAQTGETMCLGGFVGVDDEQNSTVQLSVYPNPATKIAFIKIPKEFQSTDSKFEVFSQKGIKVDELITPQSGEAEYIILPLDYYSNGIYFLNYSSKSFNKTLKLIVNK